MLKWLYISVIEWFLKHCCTLSSIVLTPKKCGPQAGNICITSELVRNSESHHIPIKSESIFLTRFSGNLFVASCLRYEKHWARGHNLKIQKYKTKQKHRSTLVSSPISQNCCGSETKQNSMGSLLSIKAFLCPLFLVCRKKASAP